MRQVESAQLVWDALAKAGPKGLSREQLVLQTGLTRHQVVHAFAYIKDALMDHYEQPLIYDNVQMSTACHRSGVKRATTSTTGFTASW